MKSLSNKEPYLKLRIFRNLFMRLNFKNYSILTDTIVWANSISFERQPSLWSFIIVSRENNISITLVITFSDTSTHRLRAELVS